MGTAAAVGVDDDLPSREARVAMGAADDEFARRVHMQDVVVADERRQFVAGAFETCLDARNENRAHVLADTLLHPPLGLLFVDAVAGGDEVVVLCRDDDRMYAQGTARRFVVFDRHLRFRVGAQIGHRFAFAANDGQPLEDDVREDERRGHVLARLVAGVTEHDALVARALLLFGGAYDALVDVGRLFVDGREHAARIAVELVFAAGVADAVDDPARHALYVDVGFRAHFARHDDESRRAERFAGDLGACVVTQEFVQDGVRKSDPRFCRGVLPTPIPT